MKTNYKALALILLVLLLLSCHKKRIKPFTEPLTFSETINGRCIEKFENWDHVYCRISIGSEVAICYLMRPVKKQTPECQSRMIYPDY